MSLPYFEILADKQALSIISSELYKECSCLAVPVSFFNFFLHQAVHQATVSRRSLQPNELFHKRRTFLRLFDGEAKNKVNIQHHNPTRCSNFNRKSSTPSKLPRLLPSIKFGLKTSTNQVWQSAHTIVVHVGELKESLHVSHGARSLQPSDTLAKLLDPNVVHSQPAEVLLLLYCCTFNVCN